MRLSRTVAILLVAGGVMVGPQFVRSVEQAANLKGKVVLLPGPGTNLVFKTDQAAYKLLRTPLSEALFVDTNLHTKVLLLKGKAAPNKDFEITGNLRSIKDGKTNELFYYCDICSIASSAPGLCQCCREPVLLREEPVKN
jgi:hypothetical protein